MIIKVETVNGYLIQIHETSSGRHRYWATIHHQALHGKLHVRKFTTPEAAWTAACKEAQSRPARISQRNVPGYSNPGGGGPFAPMGSPHRLFK